MNGFHKLNNLTSDEYFQQFFGAMRMTERQKKTREKAAAEFYELVLIIFALVAVQHEYGQVDYEAVKKRFRDGYLDRITELAGADGMIWDYAAAFADSVVETTKERLEKEGGDISDSYYLSNERAAEMAANMALDIWNYVDYTDAVQGGKTKKVWLSMMDERVRETHLEADGQEAPIDGLFQVGSALLAFPHDSIGALPGSTGAEHPEEIINCRCFMSYR